MHPLLTWVACEAHCDLMSCCSDQVCSFLYSDTCSSANRLLNREFNIKNWKAVTEILQDSNSVSVMQLFTTFATLSYQLRTIQPQWHFTVMFVLSSARGSGGRVDHPPVRRSVVALKQDSEPQIAPNDRSISVWMAEYRNIEPSWARSALYIAAYAISVLIYVY